jgi:hypothetical protein
MGSALSMNSETDVLGCTQPRLATEPLRDLTGPAASFGHVVITFAEMIGKPLDPWQCEAVIRGGELLPNGRPRFRTVLLLVSRQQGKTTLLTILSLYWLAVERVGLVLGTSTKLDTARESWEAAVELAENSPQLSSLIPRNGVRRANGEQQLKLGAGRYKIAAATGGAGRGLTVHRAILDELREHTAYTAWDAMVPAMSAVPDAQAWALSNAGGDSSTVLNDLRTQALAELSAGGDLCLLEWSAPDGGDPLDVQALASANPNMGRRTPVGALLSDARRAVALGGAALSGFRTERMCQRVRLLDPAIDPGSWTRCLDPGSLADLRSRLACCIDASPDGQHATLYAAAALTDGRVRVDPVQAWDGIGAVDAAERALPGVLARVRPKVLGWFPGGPGAALAARLKDRKGQRGWPPQGVRVEEIRAEVPAVSMGFAELVTAGQVAHSGDPLLDAHVAVAERLRSGDTWRFSRKGDGHVDALYAAAGAVHLARTLPKPLQHRTVIAVPRI